MVLHASLDRRRRHARLLIYVRVSLLVLCTGLLALATQVDAPPWALLALLAIATLASVPVPRPAVERFQPVLEATAATAVIMAVDPVPEQLLPYLLAPGLAAGLRYGLVQAINTAGAATLVILLVEAFGTHPGPALDRLPTLTQWVLFALAFGLLGAWVRRLQLQAQPPEPNASYAAAHELISQLRVVSRQLSSGLDTVTLARALLEDVARVLPHDRAVLLVRSGAGAFVPLTSSGFPELELDTRADDGAPLAQVWAAGRAARFEPGHFPAAAAALGPTVVLPLRAGARPFGLLVLDGISPPPVEEAPPTLATSGEAARRDRLLLEDAARLVDDAAPRLDTALLFEEVRSIATAEERRRLAREIHDGIAQELASLGYAVDELVATSSDPQASDALRSLRKELTRVVSELRLSIFDLRSEVHAGFGLGAALSEYVRTAGAGSGLTVHLAIDEAPERLRVETEAELLRIAQEAVTNARKHARAANLWVTCVVDPPRAVLRIEDDGTGLRSGRPDSYGLEIMRERAARIGGTLVVRNRPERGTAVEVTVGE